MVRSFGRRKEKKEGALRKVRASSATTFRGLCKGHDGDLFRCIDREGWEGSIEQCIAIATRSIAKEYWEKRAEAIFMEKVCQDWEIRHKMYKHMQTRRVFTHQALDLLRPHVKGWVEATKDSRGVRARTYTWREGFGVGWSGGFYPERSVDGKIIQPVYIDRMREMAVTGTAVEKGAITTVICWKGTEEKVVETFLDKIEESRCREQAIINTMFSYTAGFFMNMGWWNRQTRGTKKKALDRMWASHEDDDYGDIQARGEEYKEAIIDGSKRIG